MLPEGNTHNAQSIKFRGNKNPKTSGRSTEAYERARAIVEVRQTDDSNKVNPIVDIKPNRPLTEDSTCSPPTENGDMLIGQIICGDVRRLLQP